MNEHPTLAYWWHPEDPDNRVPGILTVENGWPLLSCLEIIPWDHSGIPNMLYGENGRNKFTVLTPLPYPAILAANAYGDHWAPRYVVEGVHLKNQSEALRKIALRIEGLQSWTKFSGAKQTFTKYGENPDITVSIQYERPEPKTFRFRDTEITFWATWTMPGHQWDVSITTDTNVILTAPGPKAMSEWMDGYIKPLQRLVQMLTHQRGRIWSVVLIPDDPRILPYPVLGASIVTESEVVTSSVVSPHVPTTLEDFGDLSEHPFDKWMNLYETRRRSFGEYIDDHFTVKGTQSIKGTFFTVARLIEQLRDLDGSPSSTRFSSEVMDRLREVAMSASEDEQLPLLGELDRIALRTSKSSMQLFLEHLTSILSSLNIRYFDTGLAANLFINTRVAEAHHNPRRLKQAANPSQIGNLIAFASLLVDIVLYRELGLADRVIVERLKSDPRISRSNALMESIHSSPKDES